MTPDQIRKQMMGSAGVSEEDADSLFSRASAAMDAKDYATAFKLAKRAADLGQLQAAQLTGVCLIDGLGVERNPPSAKPYVKKAVEGGDPNAKTTLAAMAIFGDAPEIDEEKTAQLLKDAAKAGVADASALLGYIYQEGKGVEKDLSVAVKLFEEAVKAGNARACACLAKCYQDGQGVKKDLNKALELVNAALEKGWGSADILRQEIEAEIQGKPFANAVPSNSQTSASVNAKAPREKSMLLALILAALFGPFGLLYVSWKRALLMLLLFILGVSLIPKNGFVVLLLWLVAPILSIILLGVGKRQPPPA